MLIEVLVINLLSVKQLPTCSYLRIRNCCLTENTVITILNVTFSYVWSEV